MRRGTFRDETVDYAAVGATQAADLMHFPPERSLPAEETWRIGSGRPASRPRATPCCRGPRSAAPVSSSATCVRRPDRCTPG